jgi:GH25 family lysozyme M1 (1,4-beta-N-acetylmuramidase)
VLDLEVTDGRSPIDVSFWAWTFCTEMNRLNPQHRVLVYTFPAFAAEGNCARLQDWALWIANWGVPAPEVPAPWRWWTFWQYAEGKTVDLDRFNGNPQQLDDFCTTYG